MLFVIAGFLALIIIILISLSIRIAKISKVADEVTKWELKSSSDDDAALGSPTN
jgi:hypothetical protein